MSSYEALKDPNLANSVPSDDTHALVFEIHLSLHILSLLRSNICLHQTSSQPAAAAYGNDFDDMFGAPTPAAAEVLTYPSVTAWEKDGLRIAFDFSKPLGQPAVTDIVATYSTSGAAVSDFSLQACTVAIYLCMHWMR